MFGKLKQLLGGKETAWKAISAPVLIQTEERIANCLYNTPYIKELFTVLLENSAILTRFVILEQDIVKANVHAITPSKLQFIFYRTLEMLFLKTNSCGVESHAISSLGESKGANPERTLLDALERILYPAKPDSEWMNVFCADLLP